MTKLWQKPAVLLATWLVVFTMVALCAQCGGCGKDFYFPWQSHAATYPSTNEVKTENTPVSLPVGEKKTSKIRVTIRATSQPTEVPHE